MSPKHKRGFDKRGDSSRAPRDGQGLEHLLCEERPMELGLLSLLQEIPEGDLAAGSHCLAGAHRERGARLFRGLTGDLWIPGAGCWKAGGGT